jgi:hypothetical protein
MRSSDIDPQQQKCGGSCRTTHHNSQLQNDLPQAAEKPFRGNNESGHDLGRALSVSKYEGL